MGQRAAVKTNSSPEESRILVNNLFDGFGYLYANDGVAIQSSQGGGKKSIRSHSWFLRNNRSAHRYDGPNEGLGFPTDALSHHLVGYRCVSTSTTLKGDYLYMYHYLDIESTNENGGIAIRYNKTTLEGNENSVLQNSAADRINDGDWEFIPCKYDHNWHSKEQGGTILEMLVDADLLDFRPKRTSPLIDGGIHLPAMTEPVVENGLVRPAINDGYLGDAPDIGAYEYGDDKYWIPGYADAKAIMAIPSSGATDMSLDRALMFKHAYKSDEAYIYFGTNEGEVASATESNALHPSSANFSSGGVIKIHLTEGRNIITPTMLMGNPNNFDPTPYLLMDDNNVLYDANKSYYWRVDCKLEDGTVSTGEIWSFTTREQDYELSFKIYEKRDGEVVPASGVKVSLDNTLMITDEQGIIESTRIAAKEYNLSIFKKGYLPLADQRLNVIGNMQFVDTIFFEPYTISIDAKAYGSGEALSGVEIYFNGMSSISDANGRVTFTDVLYGMYDIEANLEHYVTHSLTNVELFSDSVIKFTLQPDFVNLTLRIFDKNTNEPIPYVHVTTAFEDKHTTSSGVVFLQNVWRDFWNSMDCSHDDYWAVSDSVKTSGDTIHTVYMYKKEAKLRFHVYDDKSYLQGATVNIKGFDLSTYGDGRTYELPMATFENYVYTVSKDGYRTITDSILFITDTVVTVTLSESTSLERSALKQFNVYPNPAVNMISLQLEGSASVETLCVYDMMGRTMQIDYDINNDMVEMDISGLPVGQYIVYVEGGYAMFAKE